MKNLAKFLTTILVLMILNILTTSAQTYSHLGAWYYGTSFQAESDGYLEGFSIYTNAPTPNAAYVWLYGPYNTVAECEGVVNGSGSAALHSASNLIKYQSFGSSDISYTGDPAPSYSGSVYGIGYVQSNPDKKVTIDGVLEGMDLKKNKYYLLFFAVSNSTYSGNDYRLTRVVSNNKTSGRLANIIEQEKFEIQQKEIERFYNDNYSNKYVNSSKKAKIDICHTSGNGGTQTLSINQNAWSAHQAHGDVAGACAPSSSTSETNTLDRTWYLSPSSPYQREVNVPLDIELEIKQKNKWKGNGSSNWNDASNWSRGVVPESGNTVVIETGDIATLSTSATMDILVVENGATLNISSNEELTVNDYLLNTGSIDGDVVLNGSVNQISAEGEIKTLNVNNSAGATLTGNTTISEGLTLTDGTLDLDGHTLTLQSDANSSAMIVDGGGEISGNVSVERYASTTGNGHHLISAPVSDAMISELSDDFNLFALNFSNIYYYDEPSSTVPANGWIAPASSSEPMTSGKGFTGFYNSGKTIDISGTANTGPTPVNLTNDGSGWNLIGNPYPSPIDWEEVTLPSAISPAIYVWDAQGVNGGVYATYAFGIGVNGGSNIIPHMQAFFVKTTASATITFQNDDRVTDPAIQGTFFKSSSSDPLFRLLISGQGYQTESIVRFKSGASSNYEVTADAIYLPNGNPVGVEFGTISSDNENLVINSMPLAQMNATIPVYTTIGTNGLYTIDMTEFINFSPNFSIVLNDLKLGITHLLNNGPYTFTGDLNDNANRFEINTIPLSVDIEEAIDNKNLIVYYTNNELHLKFNSTLKEDKQINIYNILGQNMISTILNKGDNHYTLSHSGLKYNAVYIIDIENIDEILKICLVK